MNTEINALWAIVNEQVQSNRYQTWGNAKRMIAELNGFNHGYVVESERLQKLKAQLALTQILKWMCAKCVQDSQKETSRAHTDVAASGFVNMFLHVMWSDLPCVIDQITRSTIKDSALSANIELRSESAKKIASIFQEISEDGADVWNMPSEPTSAQAVAIESFWMERFFHFSLETVFEMLSSTERFLLETVQTCEQTGVRAPLAVNLERMNQKFSKSIDDLRGVEWIIALSAFLDQMKLRSRFDGIIKVLAPPAWAEFLCECEQAAGRPLGSILETIGMDGWLDRIGVLNSHITLSPNDWSEGKARILPAHTQAALCAFHPTEKALFTALSWSSSSPVSTDDALGLESFSHLGQDAINLSALTASKTPMRALLVGEGACGKTSLALAAAKASNRKVVSPKDGYNDYGGWVCGTLRSLQRQAFMNDNAIILIDPADILFSTANGENPVPAFLQSSSERMKMKTTEIWIINTLKDIPSEILHSFDLIVSLGAMPLADRIALAGQTFDDKVAVQVAQACATPGEIVSLVNWKNATGISDWVTLSSRLTGIQQAVLKSKESAGKLPLSVHPPRAGHKGFEDVVGQENVVKQARRVIAGLQNPERYKAIGAKPPKGILLTGGPGTGKTHLARAMAGEAGVPLLLADSAAMARDSGLIAAVFAEARRQAPCLLFLDELDAIGTTPKGSMGASPDPQRQAILNRLLTELDGFEGLDGVMVVGATHRSDLLDNALIRSGRLGLHLHLDDTTRSSREALWRYYAKSCQCADTIHWERIGRISVGMSPADIAQAVNVAALRAASENVDRIGQQHFVEAIDEVLWHGDTVELPMLEEERWRTSVHEAGHALLAWRAGHEIERVSVRPRGGALGYVRTLQEEGRYGKTPNDILSEMSMVLGGLAAEMVVFKAHGTGVSSDLNSVRRLARLAVRVAGMSPELPAGMSSQFEVDHSDELLKKAEMLEMEMVKKMRESAISWLSMHQGVLEKFAHYISQNREVDGIEAHEWIDQNMDSSEKKAIEEIGAKDILLAAQSWPGASGAAP